MNFPFTLHVNIDMPAGVGTPPLDTQVLNMQVHIKSVSLDKWGTEDTRVLTTITL